ncbi:hypothetical protein, partial [Nocardioides sp. SYSU DS0663]|uniref:hypothetical protein n=1 Tax=Nocardioides sp. SYSU DS0663 TaxID=3416445 RepID=UPI003F4B9A98
MSQQVPGRRSRASRSTAAAALTLAAVLLAACGSQVAPETVSLLATANGTGGLGPAGVDPATGEMPGSGPALDPVGGSGDVSGTG